MSSDVMTPHVQIDPAVWQTLHREVKETLAEELAGGQTKKQHFTVVDMWNIRRQAKTMQRLRYR